MNQVYNTIATKPPILEDPYEIQDSDGKTREWLLKEELDILDHPDNLLAYLDIKMKRSKIEHWYGVRAFLALILISSFLLVTTLRFIPEPYSMMYFLVPLLAILFAYLIAGLIMRRMGQTLTKLDIETAKTIPEFRETLRKLAILSDAFSLMDMKQYFERHRAVEDALLE